LQITENKTAGAKALYDFVALPARLKSCPDTSCSFNGILQVAPWADGRKFPSGAEKIVEKLGRSDSHGLVGAAGHALSR
jgi:hypothetical protein